MSAVVAAVANMTAEDSTAAAPGGRTTAACAGDIALRMSPWPWMLGDAVLSNWSWSWAVELRILERPLRCKARVFRSDNDGTEWRRQLQKQSTDAMQCSVVMEIDEGTRQGQAGATSERGARGEQHQTATSKEIGRSTWIGDFVVEIEDSRRREVGVFGTFWTCT